MKCALGTRDPIRTDRAGPVMERQRLPMPEGKSEWAAVSKKMLVLS
jgi:hypothetical protein